MESSICPPGLVDKRLTERISEMQLFKPKNNMMSSDAYLKSLQQYTCQELVNVNFPAIKHKARGDFKILTGYANMERGFLSCMRKELDNLKILLSGLYVKKHTKLSHYKILKGYANRCIWFLLDWHSIFGETKEVHTVEYSDVNGVLGQCASLFDNVLGCYRGTVCNSRFSWERVK